MAALKKNIDEAIPLLHTPKPKMEKFMVPKMKPKPSKLDHIESLDIGPATENVIDLTEEEEKEGKKEKGIRSEVIDLITPKKKRFQSPTPISRTKTIRANDVKIETKDDELFVTIDGVTISRSEVFKDEYKNDENNEDHDDDITSLSSASTYDSASESDDE